jgi:hypothetical protein
MPYGSATYSKKKSKPMAKKKKVTKKNVIQKITNG